MSVTAVQSRAGVMVDNTMIPSVGGHPIKGSGLVSPAGMTSATGFTVGPGIWEIDLVALHLHELAPMTPDGISASIFTDAGGVPSSTMLTSLLPSTDISGLGEFLFTPASPLVVSGSIDLWVVLGPASPVADYEWFAVDSSVDGGVLGWSIGNHGFLSIDAGATWSILPSHPAKMRIDATIVPEPSLALAAFLACCSVVWPSRSRSLWAET